MLNLFLALATSSAVVLTTDSSEINRDTLRIAFEGNSKKPTEESLSGLYRLSNEMLRATKVKILVLPYYRSPSQAEITERRLRELQKILLQEGVEETVWIEETLDEEKGNRLHRNDRSLFCLLAIESKPYFKGGYYGTLNETNEEPDRDTIVYLSSGIPLQLKRKAYLAVDTLPEIARISGQKLLQEIEGEEFEIYHDYQIRRNKLKDYSFLLPAPEGKSDKQLLVFRCDSVGSAWKQIRHNGKVKLGKAQLLSVPVSDAGIYRVGCVSSNQNQCVILSMPRGYGLLSAELWRNDDLKIPVHIVLGKSALAFRIAEQESRYTLKLQIMHTDGRIVLLDGIPLSNCLADKVNESSLSGSESLRAIQGFRIPNYRFSMPLEIIQKQTVNN
jgi:hypothetical protein